jgi:hypothetical protein
MAHYFSVFSRSSETIDNFDSPADTQIRIAFAPVTTEATALLAILLVGLAGCIVEMLDRGY